MSIHTAILTLVKDSVRDFMKDSRRGITLYTEEEAMRLLRVDSPRVMAHYRENGLAYINVRPRKYLEEDLRKFIMKKRRRSI